MKQSWGTKLYYSIGEVAELTDLHPYTRRAWEKEFSSLRPRRIRGKNRAYRERDIGIIILIKRLLHEERYSTRGVRQKLKNDPQLIADAAAEAAALTRGENPPAPSSPEQLSTTESAVAKTPSAVAHPTFDQSCGGEPESGMSEQMKSWLRAVRQDLEEVLALLA